MSDPFHPSSSPQHPLHLHYRRSHSIPKEQGVCALEDYTCLTGESFTMRSVRAQLRRVAPYLRIALIIGETGTLKETVALALHRLTAESDVTFIKHNSSSLVAALQELTSRTSLLNFQIFGEMQAHAVRSSFRTPTTSPMTNRSTYYSPSNASTPCTPA